MQRAVPGKKPTLDGAKPPPQGAALCAVLVGVGRGRVTLRRREEGLLAGSGGAGGSSGTSASARSSCFIRSRLARARSTKGPPVPMRSAVATVVS